MDVNYNKMFIDKNLENRGVKIKLINSYSRVLILIISCQKGFFSLAVTETTK